MNKDVLKRLQSAGVLSDIEKDLGNVPTGSYALNRIISGDYDKGIPIGMITQFKGNSSTGKTVFATHILREAQLKGYYSVLIDSEFAYNSKFASSLGLDPKKLIYASPETLEDCFETIIKLVEEIRETDKKTPIVVAYDSLAVSPIREELKEEGFNSHNMIGAMRAKMAGSCLRKINRILKKEKVALLIINQLRSKVGGYGNPEVNAAGGNALEFYLGVDLRCTVDKSNLITDDDGGLIGIKGSITNKKNKIAVPFQECDFKLFFDEGLDPFYGLTKLLAKDGIVKKAGGAWYECSEEKFQSKKLPEKIKSAEKDSSFFKIKQMLGIGSK